MDIDDLIDLYQRGWSLAAIGREYGGNFRTLRKRLAAAGVSLRSQSDVARIEYERRSIDNPYAIERFLDPNSSRRVANRLAELPRFDVPAMIDDYATGQSMAALARKYGVHRATIQNWLVKCGTRIRSFDEQTVTDARRRAADRSVVGSGEDELAAWLGEQFDRQFAVGPYNLDFRIGAIAIELHRSGLDPIKTPRIAKRIEYLLDRRWTVLYVRADKRVRTSLRPDVTDHILTFCKQASANPAFAGQYWVLRGHGQLPPVFSLDRNGST